MRHPHLRRYRASFITGALALTACRAPVSQEATTQAIYGTDTRRDMHERGVTKMAHDRASSIALLIEARDLVPAEDTTHIRLQSQIYGRRNKLCPNEHFWKQPSAGFCTGFLIGPQRIATAGHCVDETTGCEHIHLAFGYQYTRARMDPTLFKEEDIYQCRKIIARTVDQQSGLDFAVLELDRPVADRKPLAFRHTGIVPMPGRVALMGHPKGLPLKIDAGAIVTGADPDVAFFRAAIDAFRGNSGSPVFNNDNGMVEGILVRGIGDTIYDPYAKCFRSQRCQNLRQCPGEEITRANVLGGYEK